MTSKLTEEEMSRLFLPPINRAMRILDPGFFRKSIPTVAARIFDPRNISRVRKQCVQDLLRIRRMELMPNDPDKKGGKLMLLRPDVKIDDLSTASASTLALIEDKTMELVPYTITLTYDNWNYDEILAAILPEDILDDFPGSFSQAGHLAHLNLRPVYLPYKTLIANLILDKNPTVKTVVNKLEDVGTTSIFRTFPMEVLAGPHDTLVNVKESNCTFTFDFAKVYWNTRLGHEHERVVAKFSPGEAVCDVMAGVGPFAVPAGKKHVFAWANDLNPESFLALEGNIARNKVSAYVTPFNTDGRLFIGEAVRAWHARYLDPAQNPASVPGIPIKYSRTKALAGVEQMPVDRKVPLPETFAHFVMNLPASAVEFLDGFIGAYRGLEHIFEDGETKLPYIHVHTFHRETPERGEEAAFEDVVAELEKYLGCKVDPQSVDLHNVRRVAPNKTMYCASFRLPAEAAFAEVPAHLVPAVESKKRDREE